MMQMMQVVEVEAKVGNLGEVDELTEIRVEPGVVTDLRNGCRDLSERDLTGTESDDQPAGQIHKA